ncbi:hypothetical protein PGT21_035614 [Puccinia graminis f. sp. tritici]|uniref:Uncharacterized protein n=1 Tax=Puccinia graminis f. sp. tritici TaxID=56615 RepID=A0A5B0RZB7_PUCGR|nr:hypothetical protein PGT21_035614 [Puccinia graminis f. sp. tritici]KAA1130163.1 hypothetical protein PGTUg99_011111 [Puccinia graminis f. sp. tritici]
MGVIGVPTSAAKQVRPTSRRGSQRPCEASLRALTREALLGSSQFAPLLLGSRLIY